MKVEGEVLRASRRFNGAIPFAVEVRGQDSHGTEGQKQYCNPNLSHHAKLLETILSGWRESVPADEGRKERVISLN